MLNEKVQDAINEQINAELYSSYMYLSMAAYYDSISLSGFGNWMRCQAQEELAHAMKFFSFVGGRGGRVALQAIAGPPTQWDSPLEVAEAVYSHEVKVTGLINKLVDLARAESDHATDAMLTWFVNEQVEEEASAGEIVQKLKLIGEQGQGLVMIDRELAARTFAYPPAATDTGGE